MRLDLKTGASEKWDIPIETYDVLGVADGGIVTSRIVSDYPIPLPSDSEMLSAILQNSTYEFDLTDPATGRPIQKILSIPATAHPRGTAISPTPTRAKTEAISILSPTT